jgi:hypothetical protein
MRAVFLCTLAAACASSAPAARAPVCPKPADPLASMLAVPVDLAISVHDVLESRASCDGTTPEVVRVQIDRKPWCQVSIPCTTTIHAPPPSFDCGGAPVEAGAHVVGVELAGHPATLMLRTMSVPAFEKVGGQFMLGAYVSVWVASDRIIIDPPTVTRETGI